MLWPVLRRLPRLPAWLIVVAGALPRSLALALGLRRLLPADARVPYATVELVPAEPGGGYRPPFRPQNPATDPREPYGSEGSSSGNEHGWNNCTMASAALGLAYETAGALELWGGDMRHHQSDLSGGTDLYDARTAWAAYGETLTVRSGAGWSAVTDAVEAGRPIIICGNDRCPGSGYTGPHAAAIGRGTNGGLWLFGDPLTSGWRWTEPADIKRWAQSYQSSIAFATGAPAPAEPEPPEPPTPPDSGEPGPPERLAVAMAAVRWSPVWRGLWASGAPGWDVLDWPAGGASSPTWPTTWPEGWSRESWGAGRWRG